MSTKVTLERVERILRLRTMSIGPTAILFFGVVGPPFFVFIFVGAWCLVQVFAELGPFPLTLGQPSQWWSTWQKPQATPGAWFPLPPAPAPAPTRP